MAQNDENTLSTVFGQSARHTKMKRVFFKKTNPKHYKAGAFIIRCFDDRFQKVFDGFIKKLGIKHADFESVAGGAKIFASPEKSGDRDFMLRELEKSIKLHHTKKVFLFTHTDCGAYGGMKQFGGNEEKESAFHLTEHKKAKMIISKKFKQLKIKTYFLDWGGIIEIF